MKKMAGLALVLALSGCAVGPDYTAPSSVKPSAFLRGSGVEEGAPVAAWWTGLGDARLDALVAQGLAQAPQIAIAQARVMQARSGLSNARAALLPAIGTSATYLHADLPGGAMAGLDNFYNLGFDAQWEVDLWGGKRRGVEQARAQAGAALAQKSDAEVALAAEIVRAYVGLRAREASVTLLAERCGIEAQQAGLVEQRVAAGTLPRQLAEQARAAVEKCRAELVAVKADAAGLRDALAVLTGQAPGALDSLATGAVPLPPRQVAVGDPARLIENRPDIRAAERAYAAATAGVGVAKARRFPTLSLTGVLGMGGAGLGDVVDPSTFVTLAAPMLRWNFLDFGRVSAGIRNARAGRDLALAQYQGAVLAGLQDAESALGRFGAARATYAAAQSAAGHAGEIARLQVMRAGAGTLAQGDALEARKAAINAQLAQTNDAASLTLSYVALSKALGLGWGLGSARSIG